MRIQPPLLLASLLAFSAPVLATDLAPGNAAGAVRIENESGGMDYYYPADPGMALQYGFEGPGQLVIYVRSARSGDAPWVFGPLLYMPVKAQGMEILRLELKPELDSYGSLAEDDRYPWLADAKVIDIPLAVGEIALVAPTGGPGLVVRVRLPRDDEIIEVVASAPTESAPAPEEPEEPVLVEPEVPPEPVEEAPEEAETEEVQETVLERVSLGRRDGTLEERLLWTVLHARVGPRLGLGAPMRGDRPSLYLGAWAQAELLPLVWDGWNSAWGMVDLQASLAFYTLGVRQELYYADPYAGPTTFEVTYSTLVFPFELNALYRPPLTFGPVTPFAALGLGLYPALRLDEEGNTFKTALGTQLLAGAEMTLGPGDANASLGMSTARKDFGRQDETGDPAKESLSAFYLHLAYLFSF